MPESMIATRTGFSDRKLLREGVEGVVLSQVVLLRRERVGRDEPGAKRHRSSGRRQSERQGRESRCLHEVVTWSTGEKPTTKPWPSSRGRDRRRS